MIVVVANRQDAKYAKFPRRCLSAGENIEFVGLGDLGDLGVLAVGQIVKLQEKTMGAQQRCANSDLLPPRYR